MEHVQAMSEGEWNNNFNGMYSPSSNEEANFMAQLLGNCSLPSDESTIAAATTTTTTTLYGWPVHESNVDMDPPVHGTGTDESSMFSQNEEANHKASTNNMYYYYSQGSNSSGISSGSLFPFSSDYCPTTSNISMMGYSVLEHKNNTSHYLMGAGHDDNDLNYQDVNNEEIIMNYSNENSEIIDQYGRDGMVDLQLGREHDMLDVPKSSSPNELSADLAKKRPRTEIVNVHKKKKKNGKLDYWGDGEGEKKKPIYERQDSTLSRTSIEVDSNAYRDDESLNPIRKTRASRGAATDPQSLYARKRRERINERLKVLQSLVPNGTKVDISTMLEEAVQYVKFLQLQIKLLSSDDLWMYSPIAYNGMDIGLIHRDIKY